MKNFRTLGLTFAQIILGAILGLVAGLIAYFILNNLILEHLFANIIKSNGLIASVFILISLLAIYGAAVVSTGESVRFIESLKYSNKSSLSRSDFYRGAFMGAPAIIALLSIINIDWSSMSGIIFPLNIIFWLVYAIVFVLAIPIKIINSFLPIEVLYIIMAPIGAIIGYKVSEYNTGIEAQEEQEA